MKTRGIRISIKGTPGCHLDPGLAASPSDPEIVKKRYSAFFGTDLDALLAALRPDALILAGINTHACIRTAAIDAYQRDLKVILAADCIDFYDRQQHEISMEYMKDKIASVLTIEQIRSLFLAA